MSRDTNVTVISGRLTRDPDFKKTKTGKSVCSFSVASNDSKEIVNFFECQAWEKTADIMAEYCRKGQKVIVTGRNKQESWADAEGKTRSKIIINVSSVEMIGGKTNSNDQAKTQPSFNDLEEAF
jgi:single-strand DNA-binding protein